MRRTAKVGKKQKILVIGAGDIGRRVIALLRAEHALTAATSSPTNRSALKACGARAVLANLDQPGTLRKLPREWDAIIHCAPPPAHGLRDTRTRNILRAIARSTRRRLNPTEAASLARRHLPTRAFVYLSTSGVYGDCAGALISESRPVHPQNARAVRRVDAERTLTRSARLGRFRLAILRVPGIYSGERLPLARLRAGTPALSEAYDVHTNHIHAADLAAITVAALQRTQGRHAPRVRIYHASDDSEMKMGAYFDLVADAYGLPRPPRLSRTQIAQVVPPALLSFMRESRRLDNTRLKRELGIQLQFPSVADGVAYSAALARARL